MVKHKKYTLLIFENEHIQDTGLAQFNMYSKFYFIVKFISFLLI